MTTISKSNKTTPKSYRLQCASKWLQKLKDIWSKIDEVIVTKKQTQKTQKNYTLSCVSKQQRKLQEVKLETKLTNLKMVAEIERPIFKEKLINWVITTRTNTNNPIILLWNYE